MSREPLVSILIPAYNAQRWIAETIESALGQTWPRKEIIIVDDGSSDETVSIARGFESNAVTVVEQENQGGCVARNQAYKACAGDYVQWLDADDVLASDKIERQMRVALEIGSPRIPLTSSWGTFFYRTRKAKFRPSSLWTDLSPVEWLYRKVNDDSYMQTGAWLVSRELTDAVGPWDPRLLKDQDGEYTGRLVKNSEAVRFVAEAKAYHRYSGAGRVSTVGRSAAKLESQFLSTKLYIGYLMSLEDSERSRAAGVRHLEGAVRKYYPEHTAFVEQCQGLAKELGGGLSVPELPRKYRWLQKVVGYPAAKSTARWYNRQKQAANQCWDKTLYTMERLLGMAS